MINQVRQILRPYIRNIALMISRGIIQSVDDSTKIQLLRISLLADEVKDKTESMGHFGFSSSPPPGSDIVMVSVGASRDNGIIIATEHRNYRFKNLGSGESVLYSADGDKIHLKNGNVIDIVTKTLNIVAQTEVNIDSPLVNIKASTKVNIDTPNINSTGDIDLDGNMTAVGDSTANNVIGITSSSAPAITAAASLTVSGQELNNYSNHTHDYNDEGAAVNPQTTGPVN